MPNQPKKLNPDMIAEALFEVRFEHNELSEMIAAKLAANPMWQDFSTQRMGTAEMPVSLRDSDSNLRYLPLFELRNENTGAIARIGARVASFHIAGDYPGWEDFKPQLSSLYGAIVEALEQPSIVRLGLRYMNIPSNEKHNIGSVLDLNMDILVDGKVPSEDVQLAYKLNVEKDIEATVRIVSPEFVNNSDAFNGSGVIDIDMVMSDQIGPQDQPYIDDWLERAHNAEKELFFSLLSQDLIELLKEG